MREVIFLVVGAALALIGDAVWDTYKSQATESKQKERVVELLNRSLSEMVESYPGWVSDVKDILAPPANLAKSGLPCSGKGRTLAINVLQSKKSSRLFEEFKLNIGNMKALPIQAYYEGVSLYSGEHKRKLWVAESVGRRQFEAIDQFNEKSSFEIKYIRLCNILKLSKKYCDVANSALQSINPDSVSALHCKNIAWGLAD